MNKILFLILLSINSYADCKEEEFNKQLEISGEVTSEELQSINDYCDYVEELEDEEEDT